MGSSISPRSGCIVGVDSRGGCEVLSLDSADSFPSLHTTRLFRKNRPGGVIHLWDGMVGVLGQTKKSLVSPLAVFFYDVSRNRVGYRVEFYQGSPGEQRMCFLPNDSILAAGGGRDRCFVHRINKQSLRSSENVGSLHYDSHTLFSNVGAREDLYPGRIFSLMTFEERDPGGCANSFDITRLRGMIWDLETLEMVEETKFETYDSARWFSVGSELMFGSGSTVQFCDPRDFAETHTLRLGKRVTCGSWCNEREQHILIAQGENLVQVYERRALSGPVTSFEIEDGDREVTITDLVSINGNRVFVSFACTEGMLRVDPVVAPPIATNPYGGPMMVGDPSGFGSDPYGLPQFGSSVSAVVETPVVCVLPDIRSRGIWSCDGEKLHRYADGNSDSFCFVPPFGSAAESHDD